MIIENKTKIMQTIKFRGKEVKTGKWVYGYYYKCDWCEYPHRIRVQKDKHFIDIAVTFKTVGRYIGRKDKNKVEIYEDDITRQKSPREDEKVLIEKDGSWFVGSALSETEWEVLGNRFDNPELLTQ